MDVVQVYKCFCELTRLRILNLLIDGPLCVCHLQDILDEPQPKISKSLNLMRDAGLLDTQRHFNWTIYRITENPPDILSWNLACLQDLRAEYPVFQQDLLQREVIVDRIAREKPNDPISNKQLACGDCDDDAAETCC